jgi:hypothetical protein
MRGPNTWLTALTLAACTSLRDPAEPLGDGGRPDAPLRDAPTEDAPLPEDAGADAPSSDVPGDAFVDPCTLPAEERPRVEHGAGGEETIRADTTWGCGALHVLVGNVIVAGARLTIEPGTEVRVDRDRLLLIARDASLRAIGSRDRPILLTSNRPAGMRAPRDWRGLVLLGRAPTHSPNLTVDATLDPSDMRGFFGGGPSAPSAGSCGELEYVRVEFAGGAGVITDSPSAGVTFAGCGADTVVDHLQVHRSTDGLGLIGGSVGLRHVLVTRSVNQGIEWSGGYTGSLQFVVVHHPAGAGIGAALRGNNSSASPTAMPVSRPELFNLTLVGSGMLLSGDEMGIQFQFGSAGEVRNAIVTGFPSFAVDTRSDSTSSSFAAGTLRVSHSLVFGNGSDLGAQFPGATAASEEDSLNDDGSFDEGLEFLRASEENRVRDPGLGGAVPVTCPPAPCPRYTSNLAVIADGNYAAPRDPRLERADYHGAFLREAPGNPPGWEWTEGWTAFPAN